jgi:hypothetical protein
MRGMDAEVHELAQESGSAVSIDYEESRTKLAAGASVKEQTLFWRAKK